MNQPVRLKRKAKGERPYFFADPNVDKVIAMVMGLAGEVAVMRDRLDTLERLLDRGGALQRSDIDAYRPDAEVVAERAAWRDAFLAEVLRIVAIEVEALATGDTERYDSALRLVEEGRGTGAASRGEAASKTKPKAKATVGQAARKKTAAKPAAARAGSTTKAKTKTAPRRKATTGAARRARR